MPDIGWMELLLIGVVALIVVGPKDLPVLFRNMGRLTGRARAMAREFTDAMNDAADQAGMRDIERSVRAAADPKGFGADVLRDTVDFSSKATPEELAEEVSAGQAGLPDEIAPQAGDGTGSTVQDASSATQPPK